MGVERNPLIGFESRTANATFSASEADASYPATNLGVLPLNYIYRSAAHAVGSVPDVDLKWTFGTTSRAAGMFSLVRHNFSLASTFRLRLYSDAAWTTSVYDSSTDDLLGGSAIWPPVYSDSELEWEDDNWFTAKYTADQIANRTWTRVVNLDRLYLHKSGKFTITDPNNAAGYIECGWLDLARQHQFTRGITLGNSRGVTSNAVVTNSDGGVAYSSDGVAKRVFQGGFQYLPRSEAKNILLEMKTRYQEKTPFIWHPFPQEPKTWLGDSGFFRFNSLDLGQYAMPLHDAEPITLIEV